MMNWIRGDDMYKKLKKRLIFMYWLTSTLILTGVILSILVSQIRQDGRDGALTFERTTESFAKQIQQMTFLDHSWLKQMEEENHWYLKLCQEDTDLQLPNSYPYKGAIEDLFSRLRALVVEKEPGLFYITSINGSKSSELMKLEGIAGKKFYGRIYMIKKENISMTLSIIQSRELEFLQYKENVMFLLICGIIGSGFLFLLSFTYVHKVVRPVEEANEKQKQFVAAVSHEIRSPLAVIQVGVDGMKQEITENESHLKRYLYPMEGECVRMNRLIEDMLLLAATNQKDWTIQEADVDVETLLIECYDAFCMMNQKVQDKILIALPEEPLPWILGDAQRIKQVIMILLDNAMSYTNVGESIMLRAYPSDAEICIEIEDHGDGISDLEKKKIFEYFYRREESRSSKKHFGLGLPIAKRLVELHHGRIEVKDTKGHGTTFVVHLPVKKE